MSQNAYSSTTLINEDRNVEEKASSLPLALFEKNTIGTIQVGKEGVSAFPPHLQPFYLLIPLCLLLSFKQPHIIYFLCCCVLQYFKFCQVTGEIIDASIQLFLLVVCILLDILARYYTYEQYAQNPSQENTPYYSVWNRTLQSWEEVELSELKTGQIIKVGKYLQSSHKLNPVNLLPIAFASASNHILVNTTQIDKRQQYRKIKIIKPLRRLTTRTQNDQIQLSDKLFTVELNYRFKSNLGSTFQAEFSIPGEEDSKVMISNADIIPRGIPISTEEYVVGIILMYTDHFQIKSMANVYLKTNQINDILAKYLMYTIILNLFLMLILFIINLILTKTTALFDSSDLGYYSLCFLLNLAASLSNSVYIAMYIMIHIHRMIDTRQLDKQYKMVMKNRIKSIDQLAQTNTLIMDDYFFLELPFNSQDFKYAINSESPLKQEHLSLILKVIDQSPILKQHMFGHTKAITKYFRFKKIVHTRRSKIKILKERLVNQNCVEITILIIQNEEENKYLLRFNDQPVISACRNLRDTQFKNTVGNLISYFQNTASLIFFIEIMKLNKESESTNKKFNLYGVMTFVEELNRNALQLIKDQSILKKYNIVIMSTKTWKYINYFINKADMKNSDTITIILEEKQECEMNQILKNHIKALHEKQQQQRANKRRPQSVILFLNSSMITHLSRHNIRKSLCLLTEFCKYVVFYGCSQYEKQICAANLFKIFPQHIFMSNYICDYNMFQWSNLSICERGASSEMLTTAAVHRYRDLRLLIFNQAIKSIQNVYCIINSHNFKNQFLIASRVVAFFLVYQGSSIDMGINYISELYFFYNFVFTAIPIMFMIIKRPGVYIDEDVIQYLNVTNMILVNFQAIGLGLVITLMIFALLQQQFVTNVFTVVLINCVITSNIYLLFLDDSYNKTGQVVAIIIQIFISLLIIVLVQLFDGPFFLFIEIGTNFDSGNRFFFLTTFLIAPCISFLILFAFSAGNSVQIGLRQWEERMGAQIFSEQRNTEIVLKVVKSKGKQMNFLQQE